MKEPSLPYLERPPASSADGGQPPLVILLHGRGAEAKTIFSIQGLLDPAYHVLAITGPYDSAMGGREWFRPAEKVPGEIHDAVQFEESERILTAEIQFHCTRLKIDSSRIFLWGFSQGAAMALIVGLRGKARPQGVVAMSGFLPTPVKRWTEWDTHSKYLLIHGDNDEVLSSETSLDAKAFLELNGISAEFHQYKGRHKMSLESIAFVNEWIKLLGKV